MVTPDAPIGSAAVVERVGAWLIRHQPISLAINGVTNEAAHATASAALASGCDAAAAIAPLDHLRVARELFETSALCVYSIGDAAKPALTAQVSAAEGCLERGSEPAPHQANPTKRTPPSLRCHAELWLPSPRRLTDAPVLAWWRCARSPSD